MHWYSFSRQRGTFYQAEKYCASVGGSVVEINSESEYMLVSRKIGKIRILGGNSIVFLDRLTDRLKMVDGLKMSDFVLGMS